MRGYTVRQNLRQHREAVPTLRLPPYQREIVWTEEQVLQALDSAERGFPLGQILIWMTSSTDAWVLDGQQRLTALTGIRPGTSTERWVPWLDFETQAWTLRQPARGLRLWYDDTMDEVEAMSALGVFESRELHEVARRIHHVRDCDNLGAHIIERASAEDVQEVFRRINLGGTPFDPQQLKALETAR